MDVHSVNTFNNREESALYELNQLDGFWSPEKYYGFLNTFKYDEEKVTLDKYTIIEKERTRIIYNWLQYFTRDSLSEEFKASGFEIKEYYSDVAGLSYCQDASDIAIVAKKREIRR